MPSGNGRKLIEVILRKAIRNTGGFFVPYTAAVYSVLALFCRSKKISMKNISFAGAPHLVAVITFLLLSLTRPALQGKVVQQGDVGAKAMAQQSFEYKEKHGHFPRWTNGMMSGMPAHPDRYGPGETHEYSRWICSRYY